MAVIPAAALANLKRWDAAQLVETCSIVTRSRVASGAGGSIVTESTQTVACHASARIANTTETQFGGQTLTGLQWDFVFPYDTVITTDDEIIYQGQRFGVMTVLGPRTNETARRIIAVEQ